MNTTKISKYMSLVLRHQPEIANLELDNNGWVLTNALMSSLKKEFNININDLYNIVETNNKKRFEFNENKSKIRASQGHSVSVDLNYIESIPPDILYHGTSSRNLNIIKESGIKKMRRHAVHLSDNLDTATNVGSRHGTPVIILINSKQMHSDGIKFHKSTNNVWLTEFIDPKYFISYKF